MKKYVEEQILTIFEIKGVKSLPKLAPTLISKMADKYAYVEDFIIEKGQFQPQNYSEKEFITTQSFKLLLK